MELNNLSNILCIDSDIEFRTGLIKKLNGKYGLLFFDETLNPDIAFQIMGSLSGIDLGLISLDSSLGVEYISKLKNIYPTSVFVATASDLTQGANTLLQSNLSKLLLIDKNYALENIEKLFYYR